ncbi:MAG TPA: class I SAM-dependent methyltransferase [Chloroflexia bacterium]|nr:class I SAM-dependent methyltransferase [Chloroflexia bacterium]
MSMLTPEHRPPNDPALEAELAGAIEPWLAHMTWRKDFAEWRKRRIRQEEYQQANMKDLAQALGANVEGKSMLDLGAGMGGLSVAVMLEYGDRGLHLQSMDYNPDYCQIARLRARRYGLTLPITVAAGEHLPYPDASFDLITCLDVLEHVASTDEVLREMRRVLKPGGIVLTTIPNRRAFRDPHYHLPLINWLPRPLAEAIVRRSGHSKSGGPLQDRQELSELSTYTWAAFKRAAEAAGFAVRDQVLWRISHGEIRQLHGWRRAVLAFTQKTRLLTPLYRLYRYGWEGTYQISLRRTTDDRRRTTLQ